MIGRGLAWWLSASLLGGGPVEVGPAAGPVEATPAAGPVEAGPEAAPAPEPAIQAGPPAEPAPAAAPAPTPAPAPAPAPVVAAPPVPPPEPVEVDPRNYRMVLAGDIVIGLGGVALVTMATGLAIRADAVSQRQGLTAAASPDPDAIAKQDQRIDDGTILAIAGGAGSAGLFATGITLVALGYARERKRRESLAWRMIPAPSLARTELGLRWSFEF